MKNLMGSIFALSFLMVSTFAFADAGANPDEAWSCSSVMGYTCFQGYQNGQPVVLRSVVRVSTGTGSTRDRATWIVDQAFKSMQDWVYSNPSGEFCVFRSCGSSDTLRSQTISRTGDSTWACRSSYSPANDCQQH